MQEYEGQEEQLDLKSSPAAIVTLIALALLFLGAVIFFGFQTWGFVNWLFPDDGLMMKILAVVNFDLFSYVWLSVGLFLARWIQPMSRTLAVIAGVVTFLLSLGCSIIQIMIGNAERFGTNTNMDFVYTADAFIIVALVWNICTLLGLIHIQWPYISGYNPPKKPQGKGRGWFGKKQTSTPVQQQLSASSTPSHDADYAEFQAWRDQQTSPLAQPELETKASQNGHKQ